MRRPDELARRFDAAMAELTAAGGQVLAFTGFDPRAFPLVRMIRGKAAIFNMHIRQIAARRGLLLVDLWSMGVRPSGRSCGRSSAVSAIPFHDAGELARKSAAKTP